MITSQELNSWKTEIHSIRVIIKVAVHSRSNKNKSPDESKVFRKLQQQLEATTKAIQSLTLTDTSAQTGERSVSVSPGDIEPEVPEESSELDVLFQ